MTKILAIWYMTPGRPGRSQLFEVANTEDIKPTFYRLLFGDHANNLLVNYDNSLYVIEPKDPNDPAPYLRRKVEYHPLSHLVAS